MRFNLFSAIGAHFSAQILHRNEDSTFFYLKAIINNEFTRSLPRKKKKKRSKIEIENRQVPEHNSTDNQLSEMIFTFSHDSSARANNNNV